MDELAGVNARPGGHGGQAVDACAERWLSRWRDALQLRDIDCHLARQLARLSASDSSALLLAAALVSRSTSDGHVCLDLAQHAGRVLGSAAVDEEPCVAPPLHEWLRALRACSAVGDAGACSPLVLDEAGRLYLYRYWSYEQSLAVNLLRRVGPPPEADDASLAPILERLFPARGAGAGTPETDWQKVAAAAAAVQRFCVISGGPGTGKTTTVARLLTLLLEQHELAAGSDRAGRQTQPLRIVLTAPTGKAAARLQESLRGALPTIATSERIRELIPRDASTIHRLLGVTEHSSRFRYRADRLLPVDVVVVDEASMVDLALMAKLAAAVPGDARLILLGDKDQLASVEAGAVLGELCTGGDVWSEPMASLLRRLSGQRVPSAPRLTAPIDDAIVVLRHSYRFGAGSGIGQLAAAVNRGDVAASLAVFEERRFDDVRLRELAAGAQFEREVVEQAGKEYGGFFAAVSAGQAPAQVFAQFNRFRFLCAHRLGAASAEQINDVISRWIRQRQRLSVDEIWYPGRPVMVTRNDYGTQLYNGDIGIALPDAEREGRLSVFFETADGTVRALAPMRLPPHDTVYAMTVHKSQGSEFDRVTLVLPEQSSAVVSRELVYTGLTRARKVVDIVASVAVLRHAISRRLARSSGLRARLAEGSPG